MNEPIKSAAEPQQKPDSVWRQRLKAYYARVKALQGDPHYVAMGMAIGVFVAVTPTIPFHTAIAVALAFVFRSSKPAAIIGVWASNPVTIAPFYYGSYKIGILLLGRQTQAIAQPESIQTLMKQGLDVALAMIVGGAILGIIPALAAYYITFYIFQKIRKHQRHDRSCKLEPSADEKRI